jgi:hypothetical protein
MECMKKGIGMIHGSAKDNRSQTAKQPADENTLRTPDFVRLFQFLVDQEDPSLTEDVCILRHAQELARRQ